MMQQFYNEYAVACHDDLTNLLPPHPDGGRLMGTIRHVEAVTYPIGLKSLRPQKLLKLPSAQKQGSRLRNGRV